MRLTPRSEEVECVAEILSSDDFSSPEDGAKAVIKAVAGALSMRRDAWAIVARVSPERTMLWGPYYSQLDATADQARIPCMSSMVLQLGSPGHLAGMWEGVKWKGFCVCGHPPEEHLSDGRGRGPCGHKVMGTCSCEKYQEHGARPKKKPKRTTRSAS